MIRIGGVLLALAVLAMLVVDLWPGGPELALALRIVALVFALGAAVFLLVGNEPRPPGDEQDIDEPQREGAVSVAQLLDREQRANR